MVFSVHCAGIKFMGGVPIKPATSIVEGSPNISLGVPTCTIFPSMKTAILSAKVIASSWSWVTYTVVTPKSRCNWCSSSRVSSLNFASKLESGSSRRNILGCLTIARARATRCCCPPES